MIHYISKGVKKAIAEIALLSAEVLIVLALFVSSLFLFLIIADTVFLSHKIEFDQTIFDYLNQHVSNLNNSVMLFFTFLGTAEFMIPANILLFIYFAFIQRHKWYSIKIPVISISSMIVMFGLKNIFQRPRPLNPLLFAAHSYSFPSGHALTSVTFYGLIIYIIWERVRWTGLKWALIATLVSLILLIGFSRIYLRVHFASDVMAGFSMGTVWLLISIWALRRLERYAHKKIVPVVEEQKPLVPV